MLLASYNIQYGLGRDEKYDIARVAQEIAHADIIALQEVERFWQRSGMIDEPAEIAARLPDHHWIFGANLEIQNPVFRERFEALLAQERDNVKFMGSYERADLPKLMARIDWVVVPSAWWETGPFVVW